MVFTIVTEEVLSLNKDCVENIALLLLSVNFRLQVVIQLSCAKHVAKVKIEAMECYKALQKHLVIKMQQIRSFWQIRRQSPPFF
jgi:hypothetical protein